jgi:hypothetical protein
MRKVKESSVLAKTSDDTERLPYPARIGTLEEMEGDRDRERLDSIRELVNRYFEFEHGGDAEAVLTRIDRIIRARGLSTTEAK